MKKFILFFVLFLFFPYLSFSQSYSEKCITNVDNATIIVDSTATLPNGGNIETDDTLSVYTPRGTCAGYGEVNSDGRAVFAAAGKDDIT